MKGVKKEYKYYTYNKGKYRVRKKINGKIKQYGSFDNEEDAKEFVEYCKKMDWDKNKIIKKRKKKNRGMMVLK